MERLKHIKLVSFTSKVASLLTKEIVGKESSAHSLSPLKVAVCVSGGADSMALAYLLKHVSHPLMSNSPAFHPLCFIVDHGARCGSRDEALEVQNNLSSLRLESRILQICWPKDIDPSQMSGFESDARRKRYRLIARSATAENIKHIFVGHHLDDQIETLLMRLLQPGNKSLLGFHGVAEVSSLPCCDDLFEAQSTSPLETSIQPTLQTLLGINTFDKIQIYRPLLNFSKEQITATCEHHQIPFVTDKTNFDPTLTMRNAIRHLRTHHPLPAALKTERLLPIRQFALNYRKNLEARGRQVVNQMIRHRFDKRTGLLELETPVVQKALSRQEYGGFSYALARIVEHLTPKSRENFPMILNENISQSILHPPSADEFVAVQTERVNFTRLSSSYSQGARRTLWRVSRQPMRSAEISKSTCSFEIESKETGGPLVRTKWLLWDGRYWIQLIHESPEALSAVKIKPYCQQDVTQLKGKLFELGKLEAFEELLRSTAPGQIRYSLPVLTGNDQIIAFPTLNFKVSGHDGLHWSVRYSDKSCLLLDT